MKEYNPDTLVIYNSGELKVDLFIFDSYTDTGKLAISCEGLTVNCIEAGYTEDQIQFVCDLSESACESSDNKKYAMYLGSSGNFNHIIQCGFAP